MTDPTTITDAAPDIPEEFEIPTGPDSRLLVRSWTAPTGRQLVRCAPQHRDRAGEWRLSHSGLPLPPDVARALAPYLVTMAGHVEHMTEGRDE